MRSKSKKILNYVETLTQIGRGLKAEILINYLYLAWQTLFNPILWGGTYFLKKCVFGLPDPEAVYLN